MDGVKCFVPSTQYNQLCVTLKIVIYDKRKINIFNDFTIIIN